MISKNQIGFRKSCRTADHLLTLEALVKKHVTKGEKKLDACFVDLRKAYDSFPHRGLFDQLRKLGINGKLLDLVENLYKRTKCAVKVNGKITNFFTYTKGVRQGCPLSCLSSNLYVNDITHVINQTSEFSLSLSENDPINVYADDLIILANSQVELQQKMNILTTTLEEKKCLLMKQKLEVWFSTVEINFAKLIYQ